jgi:uncharacterized protein (UPF0332 family)
VRKQQIAAEWRRAVLAQAAADALLDARLPEDAVSPAYYAVLHADYDASAQIEQIKLVS